jgi:type VI secretion system protein ImpH
MAATRRRSTDSLEGPDADDPRAPSSRLFSEGHAFDFFQAVRLLQRLEWHRPSVGRSGPPSAEPVRFRVHNSLSFPPSAIYEVQPSTEGRANPVLVQSFFGLTGPNGVLPRHYTELIMRLEREQRGPERRALRDWLDLFNHRLVSLFYRSWEKYRFFLAIERGAAERDDPDAFTQGLMSLIGLGTPALRGRLRVTGPGRMGGRANLARIDDLALLHFAGLLAHKPRSAVGLETLLSEHFRFDVEVFQFQGFWLRLEPENMTRLGVAESNNRLGVNAFAGDRVWDLQSKFRIRIGPLDAEQFEAFLPARSDVPGRNAFYLLAHLIRFYVGPALDFDIQLVLRANEVPACRLPAGDSEGPALGWNSWLLSSPLRSDADDAIFPGHVIARIDTA